MQKIYDWNDLTKKKKAEISGKKYVFIVGPIRLSEKRIEDIQSKVEKSGAEIIWGVLKDKYIPGLTGEQFRTLSVNDLAGQKNIKILSYYQRDWKHVLTELDFGATVLINGSWKSAIHLREEFWILERKKNPVKFLSPFLSKEEAMNAGEITRQLKLPRKKLSEKQMMTLVKEAASCSYDWTYQVGAVLSDDARKPILAGHNRVVPFETAAMHYGSAREKNFTPPQDQNHYDTNHAEVELIIQAQKKELQLKNASLYIELMPCPACARMIARTDIGRVVYRHDHSEGYAYDLLTSMGKEVERFSDGITD